MNEEDRNAKLSELYKENEALITKLEKEKFGQSLAMIEHRNRIVDENIPYHNFKQLRLFMEKTPSLQTSWEKIIEKSMEYKNAGGI